MRSCLRAETKRNTVIKQTPCSRQNKTMMIQTQKRFTLFLLLFLDPQPIQPVFQTMEYAWIVVQTNKMIMILHTGKLSNSPTHANTIHRGLSWLQTMEYAWIVVADKQNGNDLQKSFLLPFLPPAIQINNPWRSQLAPDYGVYAWIVDKFVINTIGHPSMYQHAHLAFLYLKQYKLPS